MSVLRVRERKQAIYPRYGVVINETSATPLRTSVNEVVRPIAAHHIPHNLFKSSNQATMSGEATRFGDDLSLQLTNLLKNGFNNQPQNPKLFDSLQINLKLNNQNYTLWTRMIRVTLSEKSKAMLSHLTSDPPEQSSETYEQCEQEDLIVFSWLIKNIEHTLAGNLTKYHTTKNLWDALVITYNSGRDKLQTFNLNNNGHKKGNKNQGPERGKASAANTDTDQKSPTGFEGMISGREGSLGVAPKDKGYYVDDVTRSDTVMLSHRTTERES
nr:putative Gag-polypeptide of LTR copia-type [Tanacetum cinerariifolium]